MPFTHAGQLARPVVTARADDSIGLVAENLRHSAHGVIPVLDRVTFGEGDPNEREARVVGLVLAQDLGKVSQMAQGTLAMPEDLEGPLDLGKLTARDIMRTEVPFVPAIFSLTNALLTLDRYATDALPVLDESGHYRGLVARADLIAAMAKSVRPPLVGGMATPLGVFLTDGRLTGGAPPLGLFLSGCLIALVFFCADAIPATLLSFINRDLARMWTSTAYPSGEFGTYFHLAATLAQGMLFLGLFRLLPISGVHAAEHQTVWALERGLPLQREFVSQMPRAHPRCGTNLMVLSGLILVTLEHAPDTSSPTVLLVLVFAFFFWRAVGTWVQENFTTRPATEAQLDSGIQAAQQLIERYQEQPFAQPSFPQRLLNSGMLPSAMGMIGTLLLLNALRDYITGLFTA